MSHTMKFLWGVGEKYMNTCLRLWRISGFFFSSSLYPACEESNCPLLAWHIWDTECHSFLKLFQAFPFYPMTVAVSIHFSQPTFLEGDSGSVFLKTLRKRLLMETITRAQSKPLPLDILASLWRMVLGQVTVTDSTLLLENNLISNPGWERLCVCALGVSDLLCYSPASFCVPKGILGTSVCAFIYFQAYTHCSLETNKALDLPSHDICAAVNSGNVSRYYIGINEDRARNLSFFSQDIKKAAFWTWHSEQESTLHMSCPSNIYIYMVFFFLLLLSSSRNEV